jgi:hypothetical protein
MPRTESYWMCVSEAKNIYDSPSITIGKVYKMLTEIYLGEEVAYYIGDDGRNHVFLPSHESYFISLDEWRSNQLNKII